MLWEDGGGGGGFGKFAREWPASPKPGAMTRSLPLVAAGGGSRLE